MNTASSEIASLDYPVNERGLQDYIQVLLNRRQLVIAAFLAILALSLLLAFGLPPVYRSASTILIEQQEIPEDMVRSTVTSYADQRIQIISQRVMTSTNLWNTIENFDLYADDRKSQPRELVIQKMRSDIDLDTLSAEVVDPRSGRAIEATIAFTLSYESENPALAQKVANELTSLYLNENLKTRSRMAAEASGFLQAEAAKLEARIAGLETELAKFKEENANQLPDLLELNYTSIDKAERDLLQTEGEIRSLKERKIYLESELLQLTPGSMVYSENGEPVLSPAGRLRILEAEYAKLSGSYKPDHPDLVRLRRQIAGLRGETGSTTESAEELHKQLLGLRTELVELRRTYAPEHPDVVRLQSAIAELEARAQAVPTTASASAADQALKADNPAYIQLKAQLDAAESDLSAQQRKREALEQRIDGLQQHLAQSPQIERLYSELMRDYDNAVQKYREIKSKQMEAELGEALEVERKGERFTMIEPPLLPEQPVRPNRKVLAFMGLVFAVAGSIGLAFLLDGIDGNIHGRRGVLRLLGEAPLAIIPYIRTADEVRTRNRRLRWAAQAMAAAIVLLTIIFHFTIMPLDTFWFVLLRKLGI